VFVPVVERCGVADPPEPPVPPSVQHPVPRPRPSATRIRLHQG
jgi:hypothetical protein